jgi:hypothetical protein
MEYKRIFENICNTNHKKKVNPFYNPTVADQHIYDSNALPELINDWTKSDIKTVDRPFANYGSYDSKNIFK